jgi:hypothetical protein
MVKRNAKGPAKLPAKYRKGVQKEDKKYKGERHGYIFGKGRASYMGPGTQIAKRLKAGDKGKSAVDEVARQHDIDYTTARSSEDITKADKAMIQRVKNIKKGKKDKRANIAQANLIRLKRGVESIFGDDALNFGGTRKRAFGKKKEMKELPYHTRKFYADHSSKNLYGV